MNTYAHMHAAHGRRPPAKPIDRTFAQRFAQARGLATYLKGSAPPPRGENLQAPEEIIHNSMLREQLEAEATGQPDPYAAPRGHA